MPLLLLLLPHALTWMWKQLLLVGPTRVSPTWMPLMPLASCRCSSSSSGAIRCHIKRSVE
jgi:hypothetical protein